MIEFTLEQVAQMIGGKVEGDATVKVNGLGKIEEASQGELSFLANSKYEQFIYSTNASGVIVSEAFEPKEHIKTNLIKVENPYTGFTLLLEKYQEFLLQTKVGEEQPSFMSPSAKIGEGFYRGAFSYIGYGCKIGKNVKIFPNSYIGDNCIVGDNVVLHSGVKLYSNTVVGNNCEFHAGAVIGSDGFGFAPQANGSFKKIPQIGNVIIEDNVSIGANTTIDCATMGATVIKNGVKLDNLVQIAHNVEIGKDTVMAAQAGVAGSSKIGDNCMFGGQSAISGHITIADRTKFGGKTATSQSIKESDKEFIGMPAKERSEYLKEQINIKRIPKIFKQLKELQEKVLNLTGN